MFLTKRERALMDENASLKADCGLFRAKSEFYASELAKSETALAKTRTLLSMGEASTDDAASGKPNIARQLDNMFAYTGQSQDGG